ncbi:ISLre2 family transposase [Siminovitchia sp. 179-K 8D1 HS]|uniref:ISLre2 family transposase n=1 Tax=Siminovitchia sp. 179-K 8D1 HS TaxID=3142385 RepID=UPI0039A07323
MENHITAYPSFKEIEQLVWRNLQEVYSIVMKEILEEIDQQIAEERDKNRFRYHEKREATMDSLFGQIEFSRTYYQDREAGGYVFLLDRYLGFEGETEVSPLVKETAMELAVTGPSYRQAADTLENLLGYRVISHEWIRQRLLEIELIPKKTELAQRVLFVEVDGLYLKRQEKNKKGKEEKIVAVHQGWEVNGRRTSLIKKRHFHHTGTGHFWEDFETFLVETFDYDPLEHLLVINGDGANWITACREYFPSNAFFSIDRFHVARDIQRIFRDHPRYRAIRKALAAYDGEKLFLELNSAVGTLDKESKEERLEELIKQLEQYPEALGDYRKWLEKKGVATQGLRPMGSAEATMRVFARRMKNGRSWVEEGMRAMMTGLIGHLDKLSLRTLIGRMETWTEEQKEKPPRYYREKLKNTVGEAVRGNLPYLSQKANIPVYQALKGLAGF